LLAGGSKRTAFWSAAPIVWNGPDQAAAKLRVLLNSNADFRSRIRMLSDNLRLHEALAKLDAKDVRVQAALAATRANWHASRQEWPEAALAFDRLVAADPAEPEAWLRTPGLLRLAMALFQQDRPAEAARQLQGGANRRAQDGLPAIVRLTGMGFQFVVEDSTVRVVAVWAGSPASRSNLLPGDLIVKLNGVEMTQETTPKFDISIRGDAGTKVRLTVRHPGSTQTENIDLVREAYRADNATGELLFPLLAALKKRLAKDPRDAGLLELRAELAGQQSDYVGQIADYTAAIEILAEQPAERGSARLRRLHQRRRDAYMNLATLSEADAKDSIRYIEVAALQAWFGHDKELAATRQRILATAKGASDVLTAERAALACSVLPSTDKSELEAALALARTAVKVGKGGEWNLLALGMAAYRSGNDALADEALLAAEKAGPNNPRVTGTSAFYRAMSLFRQGKKDEARKLAITAAAKIKPLPREESNPLAGGADLDDLILWLAYKETNAIVQFEAAPPPKERQQEHACTGMRHLLRKVARVQSPWRAGSLK
jgi:hypothetical protein